MTKKNTASPADFNKTFKVLKNNQRSKGSRFKKEPGRNNADVKIFTTLMIEFLDKFDWIPGYTAKDLTKQERRGDERLIGVCYDACKYLAKKLKAAGISYRSYWICGYGIKSILKWAFCDALHSFNICVIPVQTDGGIKIRYYFADCWLAPFRMDKDEKGEWFIKGFDDETKALRWAAKRFLGNDPYMLREFNPLIVKMGSHILYSIRRLVNSRK
jgi:hypothetical protein